MASDMISRKYVLDLLEDGKRTRKEITNRICETRFLCTSKKDDEGYDPMASIVWYNGLEDIVIKWKDYKEGDDVPYFKYESRLSEGDYRQLQMVWMYLILCFGNYGTSPRSGWIEDFEGYKKWFEELEELSEE